jgi:hypothetical protein
VSKVLLDTEFVDDGSLAEPVSLAPISEHGPSITVFPDCHFAGDAAGSHDREAEGAGCALSPWLRSST